MDQGFDTWKCEQCGMNVTYHTVINDLDRVKELHFTWTCGKF